LPGWPCDAQLEALRGHFARQLDLTKQQAVAHEVQARARQVTPYVPLGQWYSLVAARANITGFLTTPTIVFWNIKKN
jgi:peptide/nickel transport system substrate-binding protein